MSGILAVGYFLFSIVFSLLTFILWMRIILRYFRISTLNPISQVIHRVTDPIIVPLTHLLKIPNTRQNRYDWVGFGVLVVVELLKFILMSALFFSKMLPWFLIIAYVIADLIVQPCNLLFFAILIRVIMSWVNPMWRNPLADFLSIVTEPLLSIARRGIPPLAGFDFSPLVVMLILKIITLFISASMPYHLI